MSIQAKRSWSSSNFYLRLALTPKNVTNHFASLELSNFRDTAILASRFLPKIWHQSNCPRSPRQYQAHRICLICSLFDCHLNIIWSLSTHLGDINRNTICFNTYFLRHGGTKQKRGRPLVAVNCTQFWGHYGNDQGIHGKCRVTFVEFKLWLWSWTSQFHPKSFHILTNSPLGHMTVQN